MTDETPFSAGPSPEYVEALDRVMAVGEHQTESKRGLVLRMDDEIEQLPPVPWLSDGILPANGLAALYGAPGAGKSFVALDLALSIAADFPWFSRTLQTGTALYLAAEGLSGLSQRMRAWKAFHRRIGRLGVGFVTTAIDLLQPATVTRVVEVSKTLSDIGPMQLVVIDTLARSMVGDENDTGDMSRVVANADAIRTGTGATVLLVHHTRKDSDLERGSSALRGAVDTLLLCREGDDGRELVCEKQKDAEQFSPIPFRLVAGHGSCIVQASVGGDPGSASEQAEGMTPKRHAVLKTLANAFTDRGASATEWCKAAAVPERTFYSIRTWLCREGYVTEKGTRYTLTPSGKYAAKQPAYAAVTAIQLQRPLQSLSGNPLEGFPGLQRQQENNGKIAVPLQSPTLFEPEELDNLLAEADERLGMRERP